jgi:hypothetical protein
MERKFKFNKKTILEKKSISRLDDATIQRIQGGVAGNTNTCPVTSPCYTASGCTCMCATFTCPKQN